MHEAIRQRLLKVLRERSITIPPNFQDRLDKLIKEIEPMLRKPLLISNLLNSSRPDLIPYSVLLDPVNKPGTVTRVAAHLHAVGQKKTVLPGAPLILIRFNEDRGKKSFSSFVLLAFDTWTCSNADIRRRADNVLKEEYGVTGDLILDTGEYIVKR